MKRKERKEKVAQMTNPVRQILGCVFFLLFFFSPFFWMFFFFLLPDFFFIFYFLFSFGLFLVLFMLSLCFWRHHLFPLCYQELSRKVNMSATASPSVLCGHLLTEGNRCRLSKDQSCLRFPASPLPSGSGFLPHFSPNTSPMHAFFFFFLSFFFFGAPQERSAQLWDCTVWAERRLQIVGVKPFPLATSVRAGEHSLVGRVRGRRRGSGSAVFCESRARSHQKPARSNSKLSVEPRQNWGASSLDFLNLLFLPTTFSFSFVLFFYIYMYICVYIFIWIYIHTDIYI